MNRTMARLAAGASAVAAFGLLGAGAAAADDTPFWLLPGVDTGGLVGPIANLPTEALQPVYSLITLITG